MGIGLEASVTLGAVGAAGDALAAAFGAGFFTAGLA
jgi:hypothetical protein